MPAATTHDLFTKDLYDTLPCEYKNKITNLHMFFLGSQGPDFLFHDYMGLTPNSYTKYGKMLHESKVKESIIYMYNYCKKDADLLSYFYGYLCHYSLDSLVHPLVNYAADFIINTNESHTVKHFRVESAYDIYTLKDHNLSIKNFDVYKDIKISKINSKKLSFMYYYLFVEIFKIQLNINQLNNTINRMAVFLKMLKPNNYLKYFLINGLENRFKQQHFITSLLLYNTTELDVYNNNKNAYFNIDHTSIKYNSSFKELYNKALEMAFKRIANPLNDNFYSVNFNGNPE